MASYGQDGRWVPEAKETAERLSETITLARDEGIGISDGTNGAVWVSSRALDLLLDPDRLGLAMERVFGVQPQPAAVREVVRMLREGIDSDPG